MTTADSKDSRAQRALGTPLMRFLGAASLGPERAPDGLWIALTPNVLNAVGYLHGGVIATLLDVAAYLAVLAHLAAGEEAVTHAFAASYLAAARADERLCARGTLIRRTRRLAFLTAELRGDADVIAIASVTKSIRA